MTPKQNFARWLSLVFCLAGSLAPAAAAEPSWIDLRGEVADAPFGGPADAVFADTEVWAVGPVDRLQGVSFAVAFWRRDAGTGRLHFERSFTREDLGLTGMSRIYSLARSPDGRFLYLGGRNFAFDSRIVVLERNLADDHLTVVQELGGLPDSANEGKLLLTPDGRHLYYGSRGIVTCERNASTGLLTRRGISSSAAVIDLLFDEGRGQLYSIGEEVLHVWLRDPASGALTSVGVFDELSLTAGDLSTVRASSGRRLARSPDGQWLYALAFGPDLTADPWSVVVFQLGGVPLLAGWGQGGPLATSFPNGIAVHPLSGSLILAFSALPGSGEGAMASYRPLDGGRRFSPSASRLEFAAGVDEEPQIDVLRLLENGDFYAGSWDGAHWQRFSLFGDQLSLESTFDGVERFQEPVDFALTPDRETLLVAVPAAGAVARLGYRRGQLGWDGSQRLAASRILLLPGGRYGVTLETGGRAIGLFRLQAGQLAMLQSLPVNYATELAASPDGRLIYAFGTEGAVFRFDAADENLSPYAAIPIGGDLPPRISPDGRFLLINQKYSSLFPFFLSDWLEYDPQHGTYRAFDDPGSVQDELIDAVFSPAGDFLYVYKGSLDPRIAVYPRDPATGELGEPIQEERGVAGLPGSFYFEGQLELDGDGRFLYNLRQDDETLVVYERDPHDGRLRLLESFATADGSAVKVGGLDSGGRQRILVSSTGNEVFLLSSVRGKVGLLRHHCRADDGRSLCLASGRFRAEMGLTLPRDRERTARRIAGPSGDSGLFEFFSPNNWESLVKVLDGCAENNHFWVYAATASDLPTLLRVTDTLTGYRKSWSQAGGPGRPAITDALALPVCEAAGRPPDSSGLANFPVGGSANEELVLGGGRFTVRVHWRTAGGLEGEGEVVPFGSADSGLFSFFHPANWELLVKVLDGCALNGHHWVYAAATTDLELRLEVNDLVGEKTRIYTNPLGQPARAITDVAAFECQ